MHDSGKRHHQHHAQSERSFCVCPECDFYTEHVAGVPCRTLTCPDCGVPLVRGEVKTGDINTSTQTLHQVKPRTDIKVPYPKVLTEKCTSCGICMDICPANTIIWKEDKAFIEESGCRNCRICIARCPEKAIVL
ncbi:MAG: hypothetical protein PWR20_1153 [Bacteroidales bacterium]|nr:hypothetical protein [Bacteroidales bacterium]MDN5330154.1 hypothetical protein [Bacteroidales bacterium]